MPVGAELSPDGVHFRVWCPARRRVVVVSDGEADIALDAEPGGYFSGVIPGAKAGLRYAFLLDDDPKRYPDPASRFQPDGPHGSSEVIDPRSYAWTDDGWRGVPAHGQVISEVHLGTFTEDGTCAGAAAKLPLLAEVGITMVELMPVSEFPGRFGWGYDGVDLYAPSHLYGRPDDLRAFVDRAHGLGIAVILDVVYNHLGPDGNYLRAFSPSYFTDRYATEWGAAIDFDGGQSGPVREFFVENAAYWIREYHVDGLRLDATQAIFDASTTHVLAEIADRTRAEAGERTIVLVAENELQHTALVRPRAAGGMGFDALWNDDLHHSLMVAATGRREAFCSDFAGRPQELVSAAKWGCLYQGQRYRWREMRRGMPGLDLPPHAFITFLENHDQIANTARGWRMHELTAPARHRALTAFVLLAPGTPMLFQGQEWNSSKPFLYFADHQPELAELVRAGRAEFLARCPGIGDAPMRAELADPADQATLARCILDWDERDTNRHVLALNRDLLGMRRMHRAFAGKARRTVDGAVLSSDAFVLRFFDGEPGRSEPGEHRGDRLLVVNLGAEVDLEIVPEPLLAAPPGQRWVMAWSSEAPEYGGAGTPPIEDARGAWRLPAQSAVVMATVEGVPARASGPAPNALRIPHW